MLTVVGAVCILIDQQLAVAPIIYLPLGAIIVLAAITYWAIRTRRFVRRLDEDNVPAAPPPGARLQCIGAPSNLPQAANLESVPFEPHVYHVPFAAVLLMQAALIVWLLYVSQQVMRNANPLVMVLMGMVVAVCCGIIIHRFRPVCYRISPGRLEILRYGFFSRKAVKVDRYDLRKARIVADLLSKRVTVYEDPQWGCVCYLWLMPDRNEAIFMFFLAAVSTYETPELSEEVL